MIVKNAKDLIFFGYNHITTIDDEQTDNYLQLRFYFRSSHASHDLQLTINNEDDIQAPEDRIKYVQAVTADDLESHIPWLTDSEEYASVKSLGILF